MVVNSNTKNNPVKYGLIPSCSDGYNCNSFSNSLLKTSGSSTKNYTNDFIGTDLGRQQIISPNYFYKK